MALIRAFGIIFLLFISFALPSFSAKSGVTSPVVQSQRAIFGMGCFWKSQYVFDHAPGVLRTRVGYTGGTVKNPTYEQVCSHTSGHVEVVQVDFDPAKTSFKNLLEVFFAKHDPTTLNRQGFDLGANYRSVIFYVNLEQKREATEFVKALDASHKYSRLVITAIEPATMFYNAEDYHQDYFAKHGQSCD